MRHVSNQSTRVRRKQEQAKHAAPPTGMCLYLTDSAAAMHMWLRSLGQCVAQNNRWLQP